MNSQNKEPNFLPWILGAFSVFCLILSDFIAPTGLVSLFRDYHMSVVAVAVGYGLVITTIFTMVGGETASALRFKALRNNIFLPGFVVCALASMPEKVWAQGSSTALLETVGAVICAGTAFAFLFFVTIAIRMNQMRVGKPAS